MQERFISYLDTALGKITISADNHFISEITFDEDRIGKSSYEGVDNEITRTAASQLQEYLDGTRQTFTLPIKQRGTDFQQDVWRKLLDIPFGETTSYKTFSSYKPLAIRAIAAANGKNNLAIIVPCHRVIGSNGKLVGYAGGLWRKKWLLQHERKIAQVGQSELNF